ncbi:MAG: MFS transporter [Fimbriimonadales bacterium]|nr:MFS transporter [Fimbriimonadales bacterium]
MPQPDVPFWRSFSLIAFLFLVTATFGFLQPFVPLYLETAGLDRREIGWLLGIGTGASLLLQPLWGRLSDRWDTRRPFIFGSALASGAAYLAFPHARTPWSFLFLQALGHNGVIYLSSVGGVLVGRLVSSRSGGTTYANYRLWGSLGYICVSLITGWLLSAQGGAIDRQLLDRAFATVPWMFLPVAMLAFAVPDRRTALRPGGTLPKAPLPPNLRVFLICHFLYTLSLYGASSFLSLFMRELGGSPLWVTAMFAGGVVCEVIVMRQSGRLSDEFGRRPLLVLTYALLPVRLCLYALCLEPGHVFLVQLLHGVNFGIVGVLSVALINDLATDNTRGQAQARLATVSGAATTVGPIALGIVAEALGLRWMFVVASLLAAAGAALLLKRFRETLPNPRPLPGAWGAFLQR